MAVLGKMEISPSVSCGAVAGTTTPGFAGQRTATGTTKAAATEILVSAS